MSESEESITVKIERDEEDLFEIKNFEEIEKKCEWCGKELDDFENFGEFCAESCFNISRRAQFKKSKFGIEIQKKNFPVSEKSTAEKVQKRYKVQFFFSKKFQGAKKTSKIHQSPTSDFKKSSKNSSSAYFASY